MDTLRVCALATTLFVCVPAFGPGVSSQANAQTMISTASGGVLTGELVVTDASHNRFRLVGHNGSFTAPAGIPVEEWRGKPVQVQFGGNGQVIQISEMPIYIEPITHGFEIVSGQLEVQDAARGLFNIVGMPRTYTAPSRIDVTPYAGRVVELRLDDRGQVTELNLAPTRFSGDAPDIRTCLYSGQRYADGASVCQTETQYRCESGQWRNLGTACVFGGGTASRRPSGCAIGGASVADGSSICRSGTTFRCSDGAWVNVKVPCS